MSDMARQTWHSTQSNQILVSPSNDYDCVGEERREESAHIYLAIVHPTPHNSKNLIHTKPSTNLDIYQSTKSLTLSFVNDQSLCNKDHTLFEHIHAKNIDLTVITETWLKDNDTNLIILQSSDVNKEKLSLLSSARKNWRGGGLGLVFNNKQLSTSLMQDDELGTF